MPLDDLKTVQLLSPDEVTAIVGGGGGIIIQIDDITD